MYYVCKEYYNNKYFVNDLQVSYETFNKIVPPKYKQVSYSCYFDKNQDFVREWVMED